MFYQRSFTILAIKFWNVALVTHKKQHYPNLIFLSPNIFKKNWELYHTERIFKIKGFIFNCICMWFICIIQFNCSDSGLNFKGRIILYSFRNETITQNFVLISHILCFVHYEQMMQKKCCKNIALLSGRIIYTHHIIK